jgi:hypothetical protein
VKEFNQMRRKLIVYHRSYGCETGCCGHAICLETAPGSGEYEAHDYVGGGELSNSFAFDHPLGQDFKEYAEEFVRDNECDPVDLDWENCIIVDD